MKRSKKKSVNEKCELSILESIEIRLILFVLERTNTFGEAAAYLDMDGKTLYDRRKKYHILAPPRNSYNGPKLTKQEMTDAFFASLAASAQSGSSVGQAIAPTPNVTLGLPPSPPPADDTPPPSNAG